MKHGEVRSSEVKESIDKSSPVKSSTMHMKAVMGCAVKSSGLRRNAEKKCKYECTMNMCAV